MTAAQAWAAELAKEPRRPQTRDEQARYYGFCSPTGEVRAQDREAFLRAIEAPWRRL